MLDYKYLLERWARYHPPAAEERLKTNALQLVQAGNLRRFGACFTRCRDHSPREGFASRSQADSADSLIRGDGTERG